MSRSTTNIVRFKKLAGHGELGQVMVRLMMACNDFSLANDSLGTWRNPKTRKEEMRAPGALRYFLRLQVSHVCEAIDIIDEIERSAALRAAVAAADRRTQRSYDTLKRFKKSPRWKTMKLIRNKVAFHYDPVWVKQAIERLDTKNPSLGATISMGNEALDWYFEPADMVEDSIVVRQIFNIVEDVDVRVETDKILVELQDIAATFGDFAGYFVKHHSK